MFRNAMKKSLTQVSLYRFLVTFASEIAIKELRTTMPKKRTRHQNPEPFLPDEETKSVSLKRSKAPKSHQQTEKASYSQFYMIYLVDYIHFRLLLDVKTTAAYIQWNEF